MIAIVLNPASGQMRRAGLREEIETLCRQAGLDADIRETRGPLDVCAATREALAKGPDAIVAGVATAPSVRSHRSWPDRRAAWRAATRHVESLRKRSRHSRDHRKAIAVIAAHRLRHVDVGRVNDRVFVNNSSIGVYPSIVEARERLRERGRSKWTSLVLATLKCCGRTTTCPSGWRPTTGRSSRARRSCSSATTNIRRRARAGVRSRLDGRRVYAYFAPPLRTHHLPNLLAHALFHRTGREQVLTSVAASELWIDTPPTSSINVACDGELEMMATPLHYRSWPGALRVISPQE
jgi:diacylglycerol kinase family enzyme